MFSGIISDIGTIVDIESDGSLKHFSVASTYSAESIAIGASISHDGVCLTVTECAAHGQGSRYRVDATEETLARTTLGGWIPGTKINLERSLSLGDELGGHLVTGHVDDVATIIGMEPVDDSVRIEFETVPELSRFIATKGSIALDGTSLTVNGVGGNRFHVMLIPHSLSVTTWQDKKIGDRVNLEIDLMARYAARLAEADRAA